jgi:DNA-binding NtrC family response regulator
MQQFTKTHGLPNATISKAALQRLTHYPWPGNVRELRNVCERLCILLAGKTIEEHNLPPEIVSGKPSESREILLPEAGINLEEVEIDLIRQALERTRGNRSQAARLLGISRDTLLYRMQKHGIN